MDRWSMECLKKTKKPLCVSCKKNKEKFLWKSWSWFLEWQEEVLETYGALFFYKTPSNNTITLFRRESNCDLQYYLCSDTKYICIESVQNLEIDREMYVKKVTILDNPIDSIIEKFKDHPSILRITQKQFPSNSFSFACVCEENVMETIECLNSKKAYQENNTPPSILIANADICAAAIQDDINRYIENG